MTLLDKILYIETEMQRAYAFAVFPSNTVIRDIVDDNQPM